MRSRLRIAVSFVLLSTPSVTLAADGAKPAAGQSVPAPAATPLLTGLPLQAPSLAGALRALHNGQPDNAARDLQKIRAAGGIPDGGEGHYLVGRAYLSAGKPQFAVLPLRQASRGYQALPDYALFHLGEAYLLLGRSAAAIQSYERLLVDHPESVLTLRARLRLADALVADQQWARASDLYRQVMDAGASGTPREDLEFRIAECLDRAEADGDAKRSDAGNATPGKASEAALAYFRIWRDNPTTPTAVRAGTRLDEMAAAGVKFPSRTSTEVRYARALALSSAGKPADALKEIDALVVSRAKLPGDWKLRRALVLFKKRDYTKARAELEKIAGSYPAGPLRAETMYWLARSQSRLNDYAAAQRTYNKLRAQYPEERWSRDGLYKQGLIALEDKNLAAAVGYFDTYGKTYPNSGDADEALWYMGWSQYRMRKYAASEATLRRLMESYPRSQLGPRAMYWIGRCNLQSGKKDAAIAILTALAREQALTYYGMISAGALHEEGIELPPPGATETTLVDVEADDADADEAPDGAAPVVPLEVIGEPVDATASPAVYRYHVARARTLIRLGFQTDAAQELIAARIAAASRNQKLELARLAIEAEYFHGAQYIARVSFGEELGSTNTSSELYKLAYPRAFGRFVTTYAAQYKYSPSVLWAIMREESTFRPEVVSPVGAIGLLQIMPYTGQEIADGLGVKGFSPDRLFDPEINIGFSAWYVRKLMSKYGGNEALAIASYNAGPEAVDRWLKQRGDLALDEFVEEIPYTETRRYVKRVLMSYGIYEALYGAGAPRVRAGHPVERASLIGSGSATP